ncbi:Shedu immune nuclease family protein [Sphingomonas sp. RB1R13]|uniref:Shedu immune nuclease family protein n=1 Tax=Sphingomonas sp. RB1R13 TaxID=3096159 RepID=UPI002FCBD529
MNFVACKICEPLAQATNLKAPHVIRACIKCGADYPVLELGAHGIGIEIKAGDRFVMPADFIKLAANPLKASGQLTPSGLDMFAELVFGVEIANVEAAKDFLPVLEKIQEANEEFFNESDKLAGIDIAHEIGADAVERLKADPHSVEWWGLMAAVSCAGAADSIKAGNAAEAAWYMATAERFRALAVFKEHFHEVVFMGHSAGRLIKLINEWDANKTNSDEGFWQIILGDHSYAFSQLFAAPVTFIQGKAYVGGTQLDGKDARYLDFMLSGGNANHAILVEIKSPTTRLLAGRYRGNVYPPSRELGGAVVQVNDYCDTLRKNVDQITRERKVELNTFNPRRIVLIGNYDAELTTPKMRAAFELFRTSLSGIEIVTFDEFFRKVEQLAKLFNIVRTKPSNAESTR